MVVEHALRNGARHLERWREVHTKLYPGEQHSIPDASEVGLHRLGGGGLLITDTCNQALCFRRLLIALVAKAVEERLGAAAWTAKPGRRKSANCLISPARALTSAADQVRGQGVEPTAEASEKAAGEAPVVPEAWA